MLLVSLDRESALALALSAELEEPIAPHEDRRFDDGEHKWRPMTDPRGQDVYVIGSLHGDDHASPQDKTVRLLSMIATLRDHGASRVSAVLPYLAYARKDVRTQPFDPVTLRYIAQMLEAVRCDQVISLEVHNPSAFENALRIPTTHLDPAPAFDAAVQALAQNGSPRLVVASPDPGGVKRALRWRSRLEERLHQPIGFAMVDKRRGLGVVESGHLVAGDVAGAAVLLRDDLVASGQTLAHASTALRHAGAAQVHAFAAHGLFTGSADRVLASAPLDRIVVTDSVPAFRLPRSCEAAQRLHVASVAPLFASAVRDSRDSFVH